jgi:acetoin utilization deacetylase AcuC-like enzyme
MPVVVDERCRLHDPGGEIWVGVRTPAAEVAARLDAIRRALAAAGAEFVNADEHPDDALRAVHDPALLAYLASAWGEWQETGLPVDPGQDRVVPYVFAHAGLIRNGTPALPVAVWARPGYFAYDTMTLIGPGTWEAARGAVDAALTAADLVAGGTPAAYACVRPPGHHVTYSCYGGSCYLNSASVAAASLLARLGRVAVVDIDAHHGNGTQEIFYECADVVVGSVHVDPGTGWFPHFLGFADEAGAGEGEGANRNVPMSPGSGDDEWVAAVDALVAWVAEHRPSALVVPLGVDAAAEDAESPLRVTRAGFRKAGQALAEIGLPTVFVQEGGYDLGSIGDLVRNVLEGFEEARR